MKLSAFLQMFNLSITNIITYKGDNAKAAVENDGYALRYVKDQTPEICKAAVERNGYALQAIRSRHWDRVIMHPDCTYLCSSGLHWNKRRSGRQEKTEAALQHVRDLLALCESLGVPYALENPIGCISSRIRKPDQIIQPWQFGDPESKATCLWLLGLPLLQPTNILQKPESGRWNNQTASGQNRLAPGRAMLRAKTYPGIAAAMAAQWGQP